MKVRLLAVFFLGIFCFAGFAQEGTDWKWSHQKPQGNTLRWIKMWDNNNWYAVGYAGTFMKTTDAGATWSIKHKAGLYDAVSGTYENIYDAHFFDMNTGVVTGTGGMTSRTTDGGNTWTQTSTVPAATWYEVYFVNANVGFAAGTTSGRCAVTTDGGVTWTAITTLPSGTYYDVYSPDGTTIIISTTSGNIRRSTDAGASWSTVLTGASATLYSLEFTDANNGWVAGSGGTARYTTDGGLTWTTANTGSTYIIYDIDYHNGAVYMTGDAFDIYKTTDNGTTWTTVEFLGPLANQPWTGAYYATYFLSDRFVTVGTYGLVNSVIGAGTPTAHTTWMKAGTIYDIWAESSTGKIIAVGDNGNATTFDQLMYSTNGGTTWNIAATTDAPAPTTVQVAPEQFVPTEENPVQSPELIPNSPAIFRAVDMINPTLGYTVGQFGAVYRTTTGGTGWDSVVTTIGNVYLYDVDFIDANTGWVVGAAGACWKTTDAGATWTPQTTTLTGIIYSISMVNATHGWLAGASGNVNATTDGGATWTPQTSGMGTSTIYSIDAVDASTAYLSGASGKVSKTTDGGAIWTLLTTLPTEIGTSTLYSIDFRDHSHGMAGGSLGKVAITADGGTSWQYGNTSGSTIYGVRIALSGLDTTAAFTAGSLAYIHKNSVFVVPVELTSFTSSVTGNSVTLNWTTASESNNSGFAIERNSSSGSFEQIAFIEGKGTTTNISSYSYTDKVETGSYTYRLKQIDYDGSFSYSQEINADVTAPVEFALAQNYPNPFNPSTVISYAIPQDGMVSLSVYNVLGQKVGTLVNQVQKAGRYQVTFNAAEYSSGIYFYKIESGNFSSVKKMMLTK